MKNREPKSFTETISRVLLVFCAFGLLLSSPNILFAQNSDSMLFKISKRNFRDASGSEQILFVYRSGRVDCGNSDYTTSNRSRLQKTIRCFRISKDKISQLIKIVERTEFLKASSSYRFFDGGTNFGSSATIIYYREDTEKIILLGTPTTVTNETALPPSLSDFLVEVQRIDEKMKFENELGKRLAGNDL